MGEVGVLAALSGRDNWQVVREERQRELQLAAVQNHLAKQEFQDQQEATAKMENYLQTVGKIKVLDPAIPGIEKLNDQLTNMVREGVLAAGGDVQKYLDNGGLIELNKYKEGLLNSPEVAKGVMSAANYNRLNADKQLGLVPRGNVEEDFQKYMKGETDAFGYQGAYKMPDLPDAREYFGKTFGKDPYTPQAVDAFSFHQFVESEAKKQGMDPNDAVDAADKATGIYQNMIKKGGQPYMFGTKQRPTPPASWGNDRNAYMSARFTIDQLDAVSNPAYDKWKTPVETFQEVRDPAGKVIRKQKVTMREADMVPIPIGKRSVNYDEGSYDSEGKWKMKNVTKEIDDFILPLMNINGKIFIRTEADRLQGKPGVEFNSNNVNKIILATPKTPDGLRMIAAYRRVLQEKGVLDEEGVANFDLNNPKPDIDQLRKKYNY